MAICKPTSLLHKSHNVYEYDHQISFHENIRDDPNLRLVGVHPCRLVTPPYIKGDETDDSHQDEAVRNK